MKTDTTIIEVYRIEHVPTGIGPLTLDDLSFFTPEQQKVLDEICDFHHCSMLLPSIFEDILSEDGDFRHDTIEGGDIFSGSISINELNILFGRWLDSLMSMGFAVYKIAIKPGCYTVGLSGKQVGFLRKGIISKQQLCLQQYNHHV